MTLREDIQTELDRREGKRIAKEVLRRMTEPPPPKYPYGLSSGIAFVYTSYRVVMMSGAYISMGNPGTQISGQAVTVSSDFYARIKP